MPLQLGPFADIKLDEALLAALLHEHRARTLPALARFWRHYRNERLDCPGAAPLAPAHASHSPSARPPLAQEVGLPPRLRPHPADPLTDDRARRRPDIVIENDIAWRIHAMVDFMFGRPISFVSTAPDESRRAEIAQILDAVFEASGGAALLQDMALLGAVYGHIDLLLRADTLFDRAASPRNTTTSTSPLARTLDFAHTLRIELIEPPRAVPLLNPDDYRRLDAMIIAFEKTQSAVQPRSFARRLLSPGAPAQRATAEVIEIISASHAQRYEHGRLVADAPNRLGALPVIHIQNISQPFRHAGLSEVEPLIPLQDELNTRLTDRAHRVTMQSFRMYLVKGMGLGDSGSGRVAVGPGQVWLTDNTDASIDSFGGDGASPGETAHIEEIRQAMDKTSSVTPVAAGVIRARIGQLSSENALRVTMLGMLAKTARKQVSYGRGLAQLSELILRALDIAGVYRTSPAERKVRIAWPEPLPLRESERLESAAAKRDLGIPHDRVLTELGYGAGDEGVS